MYTLGAWRITFLLHVSLIFGINHNHYYNQIMENIDKNYGTIAWAWIYTTGLHKSRPSYDNEAPTYNIRINHEITWGCFSNDIVVEVTSETCSMVNLLWKIIVCIYRVPVPINVRYSAIELSVTIFHNVTAAICAWITNWQLINMWQSAAWKPGQV